MEEKRIELILDVNTILEMKDLKEGKVDNSYLQMCQYLTNHSSYELHDGKPLQGMPRVNVGAYARDIASGEVVIIKEAYCNARYLELKESLCEKMGWPKYITLDLDWILSQFRNQMKWKKENNN